MTPDHVHISKSNIASRLTKTRLWMSAELADDDRAALASACSSIQNVQSDTDLLNPGAPSDALHILLDGWAARYQMMKGGLRFIPALMVPGDICDLDVLMFDRPDFGVTTLTECTVAVFHRRRIQALTAASPRVGAAFLSLALTENAILREWSASIGRRSAHQRLGRLLGELLIRLQFVGRASGNSYDFPLTQEQLGDATGLTAVHVNRMVKALREQGIVDIRGRRVTIPDWDELMATSA